MGPEFLEEMRSLCCLLNTSLVANEETKKWTCSWVHVDVYVRTAWKLFHPTQRTNGLWGSGVSLSLVSVSESIYCEGYRSDQRGHAHPLGTHVVWPRHIFNRLASSFLPLSAASSRPPAPLLGPHLQTSNVPGLEPEQGRSLTVFTQEAGKNQHLHTEHILSLVNHRTVRGSRPDQTEVLVSAEPAHPEDFSWNWRPACFVRKSVKSGCDWMPFPSALCPFSSVFSSHQCLSRPSSWFCWSLLDCSDDSHVLLWNDPHSVFIGHEDC